MTTHQQHDMYYDTQSQRSPTRHISHNHSQHQPVHRQSSRQFETYNGLPNNLYGVDEHSAQQNYGSQYNDRMSTQTLNAAFGGFVNNPWNTYSPAHNHNNSMAALGGTTRIKPNTMRQNAPRAGLPQTWLDNSLAPPLGHYSDNGNGNMSHHHLRGDPMGVDDGEELIPTAIVIKNIPFAVKKEQLVQLMTDMGLPLPYAFNYHFDNGIFRGLAFANFTTADETAVVIEAMNHYELIGRKLRVEYKKMLPLAERERIERNKRIQRGQLEEQHQPLKLHQQPSVGSIGSGPIPGTSPSPVSAVNPKSDLDYDLNDPQVLEFYTQIAVFNADHTRESLTLPPTLTPAQRRVVHTLAHRMGLAHVSKGTGEQRAVHIFRVRNDGSTKMSPPVPQLGGTHAESQRRALNRAATTDFSEHRGDGFYNTLARQSSGLLSGFPDSSGGLGANHNLRTAKSYADLRSYTPSPVPSTASFPATLNTNFARFAPEYGALGSTAVSNPNLAATANAMAQQSRDDGLLVNGMAGMGLGSTFGQASSPRRLNNAWDRDGGAGTVGPIGGHRGFAHAASFDDQTRAPGGGVPTRQPRGPLGTGFGTTRGRPNGGHSGRNSDELSNQSGKELLVEQ